MGYIFPTSIIKDKTNLAVAPDTNKGLGNEIKNINHAYGICHASGISKLYT